MPIYSTNSALPQTPLDEWQTLAYERPKHNCSGTPCRVFHSCDGDRISQE